MEGKPTKENYQIKPQQTNQSTTKQPTATSKHKKIQNIGNKRWTKDQRKNYNTVNNRNENDHNNGHKISFSHTYDEKEIINQTKL